MNFLMAHICNLSKLNANIYHLIELSVKLVERKLNVCLACHLVARICSDRHARIRNKGALQCMELAHDDVL